MNYHRENPTVRLQRLRKQIMSRKGSFIRDMNPFTQDVALWRAVRPERSQIQRQAAYLKELTTLSKITIFPDWRLAGEHLPTGTSTMWFGTLLGNIEDPQSALAEFGVTMEKLPELKTVAEAWFDGKNRTYSSVGEAFKNSEDGRHTSPTDTSSDLVFWARGWTGNHSVRDYEKVLKIGFSGIKEEISAELNSLELSHPDTPRKENFLKAALMICEAGTILGQRYAILAEEKSRKTTDSAQKTRLENMSATCRHVPAQGARNLIEAVQSLWFAHILTCGEDGINANSIGRLDQILYPYYEKDIQEERITRQDVHDLMAELSCKLYLEYDVQAIVLGGTKPDGTCAVNELSHIILEATKTMGFIRDLSIRLNSQSPDSFIELAASLIAQGGGIPFIFNDDCFINALNARGIALEDARDYAPIGCVELTIPGKANPNAVSGWINALKCLELALFSGHDPSSGQFLGVETKKLEEMTCFGDFLDAYKRQVELFVDRMVYHCNRGEMRQREKGPLPCWSVLTDDCIERGRDITDGGAVYSYQSVCFLGTANTADALMAIKQLVFDSSNIAKNDLLDILRNNYDNHENIRRKLLSVPKYGNDNQDVDMIARDICEHFITYLDTKRTTLGGRFFAHLFSFRQNLEFGKATGATPDGRLAGEPLAYSLSAHQGRDDNGVTAMLNSLAKLPHNQAAAGSAAIIDLDPKLVEGETGIQYLAVVMKTLIKMGVGQVQFNVTTAEDLKKAQQIPEQYGSIPVRVAGYSQLFKLIPEELQNHIIARTKHKQS